MGPADFNFPLCRRGHEDHLFVAESGRRGVQVLIVAHSMRLQAFTAADVKQG